MKIRKLNRSFYTRPTLEVAKNLLGKYIVRKIGKRKIDGKIIETEAYIGPKDRASHAFEGKITKRNLAEYLIGGHIYIYLVYGMYWQLNISTSEKGRPECVLIRALDLGKPRRKASFLRGKLADGPGKVCRYLKLDKSFYGEDLTKSKRIWLEDPAPEQARYGAGRGSASAKASADKEKIKSSQIISTKRIGIDYAGPYWSKRKWRFVFNQNGKSGKRKTRAPNTQRVECSVLGRA